MVRAVPGSPRRVNASTTTAERGEGLEAGEQVVFVKTPDPSYQGQVVFSEGLMHVLSYVQRWKIASEPLLSSREMGVATL